MIKLTVLYNQPADPAAFDAHYFGTHVALADSLPGIRRNEVTKTTGTLDGSVPPYYLTAELLFDDVDAMRSALASPKGQAAAADVANFASAGVTMFTGEIAG